MPLYHADLSAGSLLLPESRLVARLLLSTRDRAAFDHAIRIENVLQKSSPASAIRQTRLIRLRLMTFPSSIWSLVADGDNEVATQALFAAALKHSNLLADFVRTVVADHFRRLEKTLSPRSWEPFLDECASRDASVATWSPLTRRKHLQVVVRILAEARLLESTKSMHLLPFHINPLVKQTLCAVGEEDLVQSMELTP